MSLSGFGHYSGRSVRFIVQTNSSRADDHSYHNCSLQYEFLRTIRNTRSAQSDLETNIQILKRGNKEPGNNDVPRPILF